jgi:hypothetical protein
MKILIALLITSFFIVSCKKFLEIPSPSNQIVSEKVFEDSATAVSAVVGIYSYMMETSASITSSSMTIYPGLSADELFYYTGGTNLEEFTRNEISLTNHPTINSVFWTSGYKFIYSANNAIEKLQTSKISTNTKNKLIGECKFLRAFCYFNLVNLFGDVPLITTSDYNLNQTLARTPVDEVYNQIIADLNDAETLLPSTYGSEKTRATKWAAISLLARVYLYNKKWTEAEAEATKIISAGGFNLTSLNNVFIKNNPEAIWQLLPVNPTWNTWEGFYIVPASTSTTPTYLITNTLLTSFESGDQRKSNWITNRVFNGQTVSYPSKYKIYGNGSGLNEYYTVLRLAEQYLIRAEARTELNQLSSAVADINIIRSRAGLAAVNPNSNDKANLLLAIEKERRVELFAEWGHRWLDLKRTSRINTVLTALKPLTWQPTDALYPIPESEIKINSKLIQNPGY